jgi:Arc/MetJ-type ribon-helix-helix transcriptional regulator
VKIELTPDAAQWVEVNLASGRFVTAEDAVRYAINRAKRAEGGSYTTADARRHVREHLDRRAAQSKAS